MPTEMRHIIFEPAEVVQAVQMYHAHMGTPLPAGCILSCIGDKSVSLVRFKIVIMPDPVEIKGQLAPHQAPERYVSIEGPALAAALLLFCRKRGIPMSTKADKTLDVMGTKVCLIATLHGAVSEPNRAWPLRV